MAATRLLGRASAALPAVAGGSLEEHGADVADESRAVVELERPVLGAVLAMPKDTGARNRVPGAAESGSRAAG